MLWAWRLFLMTTTLAYFVTTLVMNKTGLSHIRVLYHKIFMVVIISVIVVS
jgi:hypothetical protein